MQLYLYIYIYFYNQIHQPSPLLLTSPCFPCVQRLLGLGARFPAGPLSAWKPLLLGSNLCTYLSPSLKMVKSIKLLLTIRWMMLSGAALTLNLLSKTLNTTSLLVYIKATYLACHRTSIVCVCFVFEWVCSGFGCLDTQLAPKQPFAHGACVT